MSKTQKLLNNSCWTEGRKRGKKKEEEESGVKVRKHKDDERLENGGLLTGSEGSSSRSAVSDSSPLLCLTLGYFKMDGPFPRIWWCLPSGKQRCLF